MKIITLIIFELIIYIISTYWLMQDAKNLDIAKFDGYFKGFRLVVWITATISLVLFVYHLCLYLTGG